MSAMRQRLTEEQKLANKRADRKRQNARQRELCKSPYREAGVDANVLHHCKTKAS